MDVVLNQLLRVIVIPQINISLNPHQRSGCFQQALINRDPQLANVLRGPYRIGGRKDVGTRGSDEYKKILSSGHSKAAAHVIICPPPGHGHFVLE